MGLPEAGIERRMSGTPEIIDAYKRGVRSRAVFNAALILVIPLLMLAATTLGAASVGPVESIRAALFPFFRFEEVTDLQKVVVLQLRIPRIIMAVITGASLGVAGAVMQGMLRNPIVSPYTLGISNGAAFGAAVAIAMGVGVLPIRSYLIIANAFVFSLITILVVYGISRLRGASTETLILAGVAIGSLFAALISALRYFSDDDELREITFWLMGGLNTVRYEYIFILVPVVVVLTSLCVKFSWDLNVLSAGEDVAKSIGIDVKRIRVLVLMCSSLLTGSVIAFTGVIGFIGLVAPHMCRIIIGNDHRFLIPSSGLMGALVLLVADTVCRTVIQPAEIPVGILTSVIGVPFFLYLLIRKKRRWWQ